MYLGPDKIILVIEKAFLARLQEHLKNYLVMMDTVLEEAPDFYLYYDLTGEREPERGEIYIPQTRGLPSEASAKEGALIGPKTALDANVSDSEFREFCLENEMPTQGVDFDEGVQLIGPLLLSVGNEEYVSYDKGCYLGQEIIARVHYKGKPPKKLTLVKDSATGKPSRFEFIAND